MNGFILSRSTLMAGALTAAVTVWMFTGLASSGAGPREAAPRAAEHGAAGEAAKPRPAGLRVTVRSSSAQRIDRDVVVSGRTEPGRVVELKAESEGRVVELGVERGARVTRGADIVRLDVRDRQAVLQRAETLVDYRR